MPTKRAIALTHVPFEDLDSLETLLLERGYELRHVAATAEKFPSDAVVTCDLLVILGGPIGVYETADYPFLLDELHAIRQRLAARKKTFGICLGAQLLAAAAGARVYPGANGAEIGWSRLQPGTDPAPAWFKPLLGDLEVLHWHGDTFDLPAGAKHLASSSSYANQAFALEDYACGLQFHAEVTAAGLERWYVGHTAELRAKKKDVAALRQEGIRKAPLLAQAVKEFWNGWLDYIL